MTKLNLGCGFDRLDGYVNVDREESCVPDLVLDLESTPWPFEDSSVTDIRMMHIMEHLGRTPESYLQIIKELYRICRNGALIDIEVPHPRHDVYLTDPTHIRPVLPSQLQMFSKKLNEEWKKSGNPTTPLAFYLDVDFEIEDLQWIPDPKWRAMLQDGKLTPGEFSEIAATQNNAVIVIQMKWRAVKP